MSDQMEALVKFQLEICNQISNAYQNYKKSPKARITKPYLEVRMQNLDQKWVKFSAGHDQLLATYSDKLNDNPYLTKAVYDTTEELYIEYMVTLKTALESFSCTSSVSENIVTNNNPSTCIKLPKIVIPIFSGSYTEWITFRDLFESLVHNNNSLDNVQKLHYLKGYLSGEAEQLLRQIPISDKNYTKCWDLLKERYNNKRFMCNTILKRFLSQRNAVAESASFLKELIDTSNDCLSALSNLGVDVSTWDVIVIHLLTLKLDPETRKAWELSDTNAGFSDNLPTFKQFREFLTNRYRALEFVENQKPVYNNNQNYISNKPRVLHATQSAQCPYCTDAHRLTFCEQFVTADVNTRRNFVREKGLCYNCLSDNHAIASCQNPTPCKICKRRHHTLLHVHNEIELENHENTEQPINSCFSSENGKVLLATALVNAQSKYRQYYAIRTLLDQGSEASFVTEDTVRNLKLKREPNYGKISGLGGDNQVASNGIVTLNLKSLRYPKIKLSLKAYILKNITGSLPTKKMLKNQVDLDEINLENTDLADPNYDTPNKIDMLLGADVYSRIIQDGIRKNKQGTLVAQATAFGWTLSGAMTASKEVINNTDIQHKEEVSHYKRSNPYKPKVRFFYNTSRKIQSIDALSKHNPGDCA